MQGVIAQLQRSTSIKVLTIGFLILVLLIPLQMVRGTIDERSSLNMQAKSDIYRTWGGWQLVAGPVLVLPYDEVLVSDRNERHVERTAMHVLPQDLQIDATLESEIRYRGIHKVPVYSSEVRLSGEFAAVDADRLGLAGKKVYWQEAYIAVGVSDGRGIADTPQLDLGDHSVAFEPGGQAIAGIPPVIVAPLETTGLDVSQRPLSFALELNLKGSETLKFLPLGDTTRASMKSAWPSPSFSGSYLPHSRQVSDAGFDANWQVSSIGRQLPSHWTKSTSAADLASSSAFGVDLYTPVSIYRLSVRAAKFGILFIGFTFVAWFMFEIITDLRLHPLQYLMVGLANVVFYLLLLSFAEHIAFGLAYLISATASSGLIVGYSRAILGERRRALLVGAVLAMLYGFLYLTLNAESFALLAGAIGLWVALALIMFLTRRIDWHGKG